MDKDLKYGWPFPDMSKPHVLFQLRSSIIVPIVGTFSKILLDWLNIIEVENKETLQKYVCSRDGAPLITVSNHYSCLDDPCLWAFLRWRDLWSAKRMRWSLAAHDICFTKAIYSWFFSSGKCVPVIRGNGVYQKGINFCLDRLREGQWVHIFPEGKVNMTLECMRLKWGVGRLILECPRVPIVIPFYHIGMNSVLPNTTPYIPRIWKKVTVLIGEPIDFSGLLEKFKKEKTDPVTARKLITDIIQDELAKLKVKTEALHRKRL